MRYRIIDAFIIIFISGIICFLLQLFYVPSVLIGWIFGIGSTLGFLHLFVKQNGHYEFIEDINGQ